VEILSGVQDGLTLGTPIALMVRNEDARGKDYSEMREKYRPSHADYTYQAKYGIRAVAGGGRASARETVGRVELITRPNWGLRIGVALLVVATLLGPLFFSALLRFSETVGSLGDFLEATDAGLHMLLVLGGAIAFLVTLEGRLQRRKALSAIAATNAS